MFSSINDVTTSVQQWVFNNGNWLLYQSRLNVKVFVRCFKTLVRILLLSIDGCIVSSSASLTRFHLPFLFSAFLLVLLFIFANFSSPLSCRHASCLLPFFSFPFVNAGGKGSISSSSHTCLISATVKATLRVALNSSSRFLRVISAILTTYTISSTDLRKLFKLLEAVQHHKYQYVSSYPRVIQSRSNHWTNRQFVFIRQIHGQVDFGKMSWKGVKKWTEDKKEYR